MPSKTFPGAKSISTDLMIMMIIQGLCAHLWIVCRQVWQRGYSWRPHHHPAFASEGRAGANRSGPPPLYMDPGLTTYSMCVYGRVSKTRCLAARGAHKEPFGLHSSYDPQTSNIIPLQKFSSLLDKLLELIGYLGWVILFSQPADWLFTTETDCFSCK